MPQSRDPERLRNKEGTRGNAWISLGQGNRIDFAGGLGASGHGKHSAMETSRNL